jgi:signal transduction histidine kinase
MNRTKLSDIVGPEYTKLGFFREVQEKMGELETYNAELERKKQEIQDILNGIMDLLAVVSPDYRIVYVNKVFHDYFDIDEPKGMYCYEVFRGRSTPCRTCPLRTALQTGKPDRTSYLDPRSERNLRFEVVASPMFDDKGQVRTVLVSKRDVTMEKEYQAKYYQAEKMATIGLLAAGVAHEINNPLTAVYGLAEGIRRRLPAIRAGVDAAMYADIAEYVETILMECRRCRDIVRSMLSFSRPHTLAFSPISLNEVVTDTLNILRGHLEERGRLGLTLTVNLFEGLPLVAGDEAQLKQVLLNLLTNSMDAITGLGEITITTHPENDNTVNLSVEDTGGGIPPENMDKLFNPFFTTKPVGKGIGIGLATCYSIVREHHGSIEVASEVGLGTHFTVKLPLDSGQNRE